MARKAVHNLPKFRDNAPFPRPDRPREWVEQQGSLKRLGQSLLVDEEPFADRDEPIRAIPDPWAQARTCAEALTDQDHSMHRAFVAQWRGLLALIGLRRLYAADYTLDSRPVSLEGNHIFNRVLTRLSPRIAIGDAFDLWSRPAVIYVTPKGGRPLAVGMMNPACLVSPGRLANQVRIPNVAWAQDGLRDPLALTGDRALSPASLVALKAYVEHLRSKLGGFPPSDVGDAIRERLQDYVDDIDDLIGVSPLTATVGQGFEPDLDQLYHGLWSTVDLKPVENPAATSQCRLLLKKRNAPGALKGIILVDESLGKVGGGNGREMLVWGTRTLFELIGSKPKFDEVRREAASQGYLLITADDLFTPRAVRLRKNPRIAGHPVTLKDMLLPIRPIALLLEGNVPAMIEADGDGARCSVQLKVKLERDDGSIAHSLIRHYRTESGTDAPLYVTDANWAFFNATVWPDFKSSVWSNYFARLYYQKDIDQIRPRQALSQAIIEAALAGATDGLEAVSLLSRINHGHELDSGHAWNQVSEKGNDIERDRIQLSDRPFEAIFYSDYDEDRGEGEAGCAWLDIDLVQTNAQDTVVAFDFGTTNSVACFDKDGEPIEWDERLVNPISFDDQSTIQQQRKLYRWQFANFLPPDKRATPTPTVVISRLRTTDKPAHSTFRNVIYFNPRAEFGDGGAEFAIARYERFIDQCIFNLKWSDDAEHVQAASDFLEQAMMMVAAEAAARGRDPARMKWRFSLPDSMLGRTRNNFENHLGELTVKYGQLDGVYSEGMAAGKYMLAGNSGAKVVPGSINAVFDIGGGTTDITLWRRDEALWRGSFRLAGQAFFTSTMVKNPQILRMIGLNDWADLLADNRVTPDNLNHWAELLFSGPELNKALDDNWSLKMSMSTGATLRAAALVFLGGLAYYVGLVARQLIDEGVLDEEDLRDPTFSLCGRGAGIFRRIHGKLKPDADGDVTRALTLFSYAAATEGTPRPQLFIEPKSKLEVVRGMITDYENINARVDSRKEPRSGHLPAGLDVTFVSGTMMTAHDLIGASGESAKVKSVDIASLEAMLAKLQQETEIDIDLRKNDSDGAYRMICNEVRAHVDRSRDELGQLIVDEPPFVTALRALIGEIAKPETDSRRRIEVKA